MTRPKLYPRSTWIWWILVWPLALITLGFLAVTTTDVHTLAFDNAGLWWLGALGPLAGLIVLYGVGRKRRAMERFTSEQLAPLLGDRVSSARQAFRAGTLVTAVLMIVVGLLGPRWGMYLEKQRVFGSDMVVALDVSRSMLAQDIQPNRLEAAKLLIRQQLTERASLKHSNRLALLAFAGSTSLKLPLSTDHLAFRTKLEDIKLGSAPRGGTAIAEAIRSATDLFAKSPEQATRIILLFTDGEDHEGGPVEAAKEAFDTYGIRTFAIAVGDPARTVGAQVPSGISTARKPLLYDGQIVFSKVDLASLQQIAAAGQGQAAALPDLHRLVDAIGGMRKTELSNEERIRRRPQYQWFLTVALILLLLEAIISERRTSVENLPRRVWQQETTE